eukprot:gene9138-8236_t
MALDFVVAPGLVELLPADTPLCGDLALTISPSSLISPNEPGDPSTAPLAPEHTSRASELNTWLLLFIAMAAILLATLVCCSWALGYMWTRARRKGTIKAAVGQPVEIHDTSGDIALGIAMPAISRAGPAAVQTTASRPVNSPYSSASVTLPHQPASFPANAPVSSLREAQPLSPSLTAALDNSPPLPPAPVDTVHQPTVHPQHDPVPAQHDLGAFRQNATAKCTYGDPSVYPDV